MNDLLIELKTWKLAFLSLFKNKYFMRVVWIQIAVELLFLVLYFTIGGK